MQPFEYCLLGIGAIACSFVCGLEVWLVRKSQKRMERLVSALEAIVSTQQMLAIESDEHKSQEQYRSIALLEEQAKLQRETVELLKKLVDEKDR